MMNTTPRRICVYAGARAGNSDEYEQAAVALGTALVRRGFELVYGGGGVGLMGAIASTVLRAGGNVIGIIPEALAEREQVHPGLTRLEVVSTMHERKRRMAELAQGFVALPGGLGTLEELFEAVTLTQLGYQRKPVGLFNCMGYYDGLLGFLEHAVGAGFMTQSCLNLILVEKDGDRLVARLDATQRTLESTAAS